MKKMFAYLILIIAFLILFIIHCNDDCVVSEPTVSTPTPTETVDTQSDAALLSLEVIGYDLSPAFSSDTTNYTVQVANTVDTIEITAETASSTATMTINGDTTASGDLKSITLSGPMNTININITAGDSETTKKYTIVVQHF